MRVCIHCKEFLPRLEFPLRSRMTGARHNRCKECQRRYSRAHYAMHGHKHNARRYQNQKRSRVETRRRFAEYLVGKACIDCGICDTIVLEFDHVRGQKVANLSEMVSNGWPWTQVEDELAKCEIRCANCHRRKTAHQLKWFRALGGGA